MRLEDLAVSHRYADVNGIRMHYVEKGDGPLVVLLHGFPEMWWSWRHQIPALADAGYRVVAPDLRGYAETDKRGPYDLDTLATDVRELIRHANGGDAPAQVVAHDWGGAIAWHLAATRPEAVSRLTVLNCPHPAQMARALFGGRFGQIKRSWYIFFFQLPLLPEHFLTRRNGLALRKTFRGMAVDTTNFSDEEIEPIVSAMLAPGAASATIGYYRAMFTRALTNRKSLARPRTITAPTLLVWAMDDLALGYDDLVPGTERFVADLRIERIARCGHFAQSERPELVNPLVLSHLEGGARDGANGRARA